MNTQKQKTILLVEEEVISATDEAQALKKYGYQVIRVHSGEKAITAIQNSPKIDLVLMNSNLGSGLDGTQAAEIILQQRDVPLIFLSSPTDRELVTKTGGINSYGHFVKSSGEAVLIATIKTAFRLFETRVKERQKEEALHQAHERLALAQRAAGAGIWDWDLATEKLEWSPELFRLFGLDPATAVASFESWRGVLHPQDREAAEDRISAALQDHRRLEVEYRFVLPSGETRWISAIGNTTYAADGRPLSIAGICLDVTARKQAEEELKKTRERLRALSAHIQSVREEERANISREIHDDLGQMLTALKLDLAWFLRNLRPDQPELTGKAKTMGRLIDQTVKTIRRISTELRPRILDDFGLVAALEWQAQEFANKTGIPCRFRSTVRKLALKADRPIAVFRIFQEALTNVARHSQATRVEAFLKKDAGGLVLTIRDNGRGISEKEIARSPSLGLVGMRERALIFGGTVEIQGNKGKGTSVILRLPAAQ